MLRKRKATFSEPGQVSSAGLLVRRGRVLAIASVLAVAPMITGFPQVSSPTQPHPVQSHVHKVGFVRSSVTALRTARNATRSAVNRPGAPDPITTARAGAVTPVQNVAGPVTVVGVTWPKGAVSAHGQFQIRTFSGTTWSQWALLGAIDGGPDGAEAASANTGTDPYVVTGASKYEVRSLTTDSNVPAAATVQVVDPGTSSADNVAQAPGAAAAATAKPPIYTRAQWGADETLHQGKTPLYGQVQLGFVHHTADSGNSSDNTYTAGEVPAMIRGMYAYHLGLGWDDIGYNFLIDRFGRTWEGRYGGMDKAVVGAQTLSYNSVSTGVAAIGNFEIAEVPQAVTDAFKRIFAWKFSLAGIPATGASPELAPDGTTPLQRVSGHRDAFPTICPGKYLSAKLPEISAGAAAIMSASGPGVPSPGDFTGDGWLDLIARQTSTGSLYLYPGNGTGFPGRVRIGGGWGTMNTITRFGDFNVDGHEDVIARESATGSLWLYQGTGSGLGARVKIGISGWNGMREITPVGDLNGDRYPDLLAVETSSGSLYLYPGRGTSLGARRLIGSGWNTMSELAGVGDFNRDTHVDLIARHTATGVLWLYPGTVSGLGSRVRIGGGWNGMRDLVGVGDFDREGSNDLIAVESATNKLFKYPGSGTSLGPRLQLAAGWTADYSPVL